MRPSYESLPTWLGRVPKLAPTPVRPHRLPTEGVLTRTLRNPRLPLHVAVLAVGLGIGAAVAAGSVRARHAAESRAEMSALATRKAVELRAFGMLSGAASRRKASPLAAGGSLTEDVAGYFDVVEGADGRRFRRRWTIDSAPGGQRRIVVQVRPTAPDARSDALDPATAVTQVTTHP